MRIAHDVSGNRVDASKALHKTVYTCPVCGESVILKAVDSKAMRPHFSHRAKSLCDEWKSDMSEWHYSWQEKFPVECREVILEKDGVKHRADVLIKDRVIEFQHSPISAEEFNARNEFYLGCGKKLIWIFDMAPSIKNIYRNSAAIPTNHDGFLQLKRTNSYMHLKGYNMYLSRYSLFFQVDNRLFWIFEENENVFTCFNPDAELTTDSLLKDLGCLNSDGEGTKSIRELWKKEKTFEQKMQLMR